MNESLSEMVKGNQPEETEPASFEQEMEPQEDSIVDEQKEIEEVQTIRLIPLSEWFDVNADNFTNISPVKVSIRGVDPNKTLIVAVNDDDAETDSEGNAKRDLQLFKNADIHPVLDLPGIDMQVYNNGFKIVHQYSNNIFIKCYGVRTGLITVFCNNIGGKLIPYNITKVKKRDAEIIVKQPTPPEQTQTKLNMQADLEALQLLYKQSVKVASELRTNQDIINWLISRQAEVTDINHHFQIDSVIIDTLR